MGGGTNRVLLLTGEPFFGEMLAAVVREDGHEVEIAPTFAEALDRVSSGWADVVLVEALTDAELVAGWLAALGNAGARVALVYGRDTAALRFHPCVAYSMFAQTTLDDLRLFIARCAEPRDRKVGTSGVRDKAGASPAGLPDVVRRRR